VLEGRDRRGTDREAAGGDERRLRLALARSQALDTVYGFRMKLEKLWENNAQSNDTLLQHFKDWCHEAEQSGIASLQEFAAHLRSYTLPQAAALIQAHVYKSPLKSGLFLFRYPNR